MPKRSSKRRDASTIAFDIVAQATGEERHKHKKSQESEKNPAAVTLGRLGGLKGGKARAKSLTAAQRAEIAKVAATARWKKSR